MRNIRRYLGTILLVCTGFMSAARAADVIPFDTSSPAQIGTGAPTSRAQAANAGQFVTLTDFGASTGGTQAQNTSAAQNAIEALSSKGGGTLYIPPGTYPVCGLILTSKIHITGAGRNVTILDGSSCHSADAIVYGPSNAYSLFKTKASAGIFDWALKDITIKGNLSHSHVDCLGTYGYRFTVDQVELTECGRNGWHTEGGNATRGPMESYVNNLLVDTVNATGIFNNGPHDSNFDNVIIVDAGQGAHDTYAGMYLGRHTNVRAKGFHAWHTSTATNRVRNALHVEGWGSTFTSSNFEGSFGPPVLVGTGASINQFACDNAYYNRFSPGPLILIRGPSNYICGSAMNNDPGTLPSSVGIQLGDHTRGENVSNNMISLQQESNNGGSIDFSNDAGGNMIRIVGYQSSGPKYLGRPHPSDDIDLIVTGVEGSNLHQHP
ncbi:hypothetical protein J2R99_002856 [Rhodopseudomonas julia]|uniref:Rhamnogalacturonase A/B/Epimerase-like pectate lyase domain-containing protein n=1 Tax=Rhodopseudomonas julia TaxID=200617 RepID=A0ABU0C9V7_9BRAD|nr:glycosyl hydrolase family 28-related protein [Rhodopseudomonas julia]MDQ0326987.1 hypothetical protein [Rhodopseudomonas julia]